MQKYRLLIICILIVWLLGCAASRHAHQVKMANLIIFNEGLPTNVEFRIVAAKHVAGGSVGHLEYLIREEAVKLGANAARIGSIGTLVGLIGTANDAFVTYLYYEPTPENQKAIQEFFESSCKEPTSD